MVKLSQVPSDQEAMIIPLGAPMELRFASYEGSLAGARRIVKSMSDGEREQIAVWSPGHIFTAAELLAEIPGHEHDPLSPTL